jgi:hypothetical protein
LFPKLLGFGAFEKRSFFFFFVYEACNLIFSCSIYHGAEYCINPFMHDYIFDQDHEDVRRLEKSGKKILKSGF